jgi:asparagine synthase (glutamine-hydrolysing)
MIAAAVVGNNQHPAGDSGFARLLEFNDVKRAAFSREDGCVLVQLISRQAAPPIAAWRPACSGSGRLVLFNGQFHNQPEIARQLGVDARDAAGVYAAAVDHWGHSADDHVIGEYCAIAKLPGETALRLARSPFRAPPLHFRLRDDAIIASSAIRSLFWGDPAPRKPDLHRLSQTMMMDFGDLLRGWWEGCGRIPVGSVVELERGDARIVWQYDLFSRPKVRLANDQAYVDAARALFDEGVRKALEGTGRPGILVSGGLDSSQVAVSALQQGGAGFELHGFTYGPEKSWSGRIATGHFLDEYGRVVQLAKDFPNFRTHSFGNEGLDFSHRQREIMQIMDCAPPSLGLIWQHHEIYAKARQLGCDILLGGDFGNEGISNEGRWGFVEYFLTGRWVQLWRALRGNHADTRPMWRRFVSMCLMPLLPRRLWLAVSDWWHGGLPGPLSRSGLSPAWATRHDMIATARRRGNDQQRFVFPTRRSFWAFIQREDSQDVGELEQAMELLHGLQYRDPTAYRPLIEFCYGIPTDQYLRDGVDRWLARRMALGRLPEEQRLERAIGSHNVDWHLRLTRSKDALLDEIARMAADPDIAAVIDLEGIRQLLTELPDVPPFEQKAVAPYVTAIPLGISAGRFIAYAKGRNDI